MLVLVGKDSPFFNKDEAKDLFEINRENLDDEDGFEALLNKSCFFNLYNKGYFGSIFVYDRYGDYYLGGYAKRHHLRDNIEAVKRVADMFDVVFAETRHKEAVKVLFWAGFKWFDKDNGILRRLKNEQ